MNKLEKLILEHEAFTHDKVVDESYLICTYEPCKAFRGGVKRAYILGLERGQDISWDHDCKLYEDCVCWKEVAKEIQSEIAKLKEGGE